MTKMILSVLVLLFMAPAFLSNSGNAVAEVPAPTPVAASAQTQEQPTAETADLADVLATILNQNHAFGPALQQDAALIESACFALLDFSEEGEVCRVIRQTYVNTFIQNMYGAEVDPAAGEQPYFTAPQGYYVIPPRGLTRYAHEILRTEVSGSTVTVLSAMTVAAHDAASYDALVESVFIANPNSPLGYNLVRCEILG